MNIDLESFGKMNIWHGIFQKSFSDYIFYKHREETWISKNSSLCALSLNQMWIERCSTCHESTFSRARIENQESLEQKVWWAFTSNNMLPQELEVYSGNADAKFSDLLRAFSYESYAQTQNFTSSLRITDHALSTTAHFCPEILETVSELRNDATRLRHVKH